MCDHGPPCTHPGAPTCASSEGVFTTHLSSPPPAEGPALPEPHSRDPNGLPSARKRRVSCAHPRGLRLTHSRRPEPAGAQADAGSALTPARPGLQTSGLLRPSAPGGCQRPAKLW